MRVPDGASKGIAKVIVSLSDWPSVEVKPNAFEVYVVDDTDPEIMKKRQQIEESRKKLVKLYAEKTERMLKHCPFDQDNGENVNRLSEVLQILEKRYGYQPFLIDAKEFGIRYSSEILDRQIRWRVSSSKDVATYLKEWLTQVNATYQVRDGVIQIVPLREKR